MHKKLLTSMVATATAMTMVLTPCITVFAEDPQPATETVKLDDNSGQNTEDVTVEVSSITVDKGQSAIVITDSDHTKSLGVEVTGDVTSTGYSEENGYTDALGRKYNYSQDAVKNNGGVVEIGGSVNANADEQNAIIANNGAYVAVGKNVNANNSGIVANGKNTFVTVEDGNVSAAKDAITANSDAVVEVNGNVNSTGHDIVLYSDWDPDAKEYKTKKPGTTGYAIHTDGSATVSVDGDVIGTSNGLGVFRGLDTSSTKGSIIVTGTLTASGENSADIQIGRRLNNNHESIQYATTEDILNGVPDITVHSLGNGRITNGLVPTSEEGITTKEVTNKIIEAINYIIKLDPEAEKDYSLKLSEDNSNVKPVSYGDTTLNTVNIAKQFNVAANLPEGYELVGGSNHMDVKDNGDGTYTLKLLDTKGGIYITARLRPVPTSDISDASDSSASTDSSQEYQVVIEQAAAYADPAQAPAGAIVVNTSSQASSASGSAAPVSAISGDKPARTVSYSISKVTPIQYKNSIIQNVSAAPQGGAFNIETDRVTCFDSKMIDAIASRPDIDVNVVFTYGGKKLKVTIPAGYNVKSLLDSNGYCGFLRLLSILGGEEIK